MVTLVILIPSMVMVYKTGEKQLTPQQLEEQLKNIAPPKLDDARHDENVIVQAQTNQD